MMIESKIAARTVQFHSVTTRIDLTAMDVWVTTVHSLFHTGRFYIQDGWMIIVGIYTFETGIIRFEMETTIEVQRKETEDDVVPWVG